MSRRLDSVNSLIQQKISQIISTEVKDPRLTALVSVTAVHTSPDLRRARVFVSILGSDVDKRATLKGLKSATGFIQRSMQKQVSLKFIPAFEFRLDESMEHSFEIQALISEETSGLESKGNQETN